MVLVNFPLKNAHLGHFLSPRSYLSTVVAATHQGMQSETKCTNPCHPLPFSLATVHRMFGPSFLLLVSPAQVFFWLLLTQPRTEQVPGAHHTPPLHDSEFLRLGAESCPLLCSWSLHTECVSLSWETPAHMGSVPRESILNLKYISCVRHIRKINDSGCRSLGISFMIFVYERQKGAESRGGRNTGPGLYFHLPFTLGAVSLPGHGLPSEPQSLCLELREPYLPGRPTMGWRAGL